MIRAWLWRSLDAVAHVLYAPLTLGRQHVSPPRWYHHVHLIPGWLFGAVCGGYERRLCAPLTEAELRDVAYARRDDVVPGSGVAIAPWRPAPLTVEEEAAVVRLAAERANEPTYSLADVAATFDNEYEDLTEDEFDALAASGEQVMVVGRAAPDGWTCEHVTMTAGGASLISAQAWCGCVMQPYYATTTR